MESFSNDSNKYLLYRLYTDSAETIFRTHKEWLKLINSYVFETFVSGQDDAYIKRNAFLNCREQI